MRYTYQPQSKGNATALGVTQSQRKPHTENWPRRALENRRQITVYIGSLPMNIRSWSRHRSAGNVAASSLHQSRLKR